MTCAHSQNLKSALAGALRRATGLEAEQTAIRLPARGAAAGFYVPPDADARAVADAFPLPAGELYGAPLIESVHAQNGWLLLELTDAFYSAAVETVLRDGPLPKDDLGNHTLNRLIGLARKPGRGCPARAEVQRALIECLCLGAGVGLKRAERTIERALCVEPLAERQALIEASGAFFGAAARLIYDEILSKGRDIYNED